MISHKELLEVIVYDPNTGEFRWKKQIGRKSVPGQIAGTSSKRYRQTIRIYGKLYYAHRLAWYYMTGNWPKDEIDHINGNKHDNRWANLREATTSQNAQNRALNNNNSSGYIGVHWLKRDEKWRSVIRINYKKIVLGYFDCKEEAKNAYLQAKQKYHTFNPIPR